MERISTADFVIKYKHVNFKKMAKTASDPHVRDCLLCLFYLVSGFSRIESGKKINKSDEWVRKCVLDYHNGGYDNLFYKPRPGQSSFLTKEQEQELVSDIMKMQDERNGGRIIAADIHIFVNEKYKVNYKLKSIYDLLERIGMSWVSSRSKHPMSDEKEQNNFKKTFKGRVGIIKKNIVAQKTKKKTNSRG